jgi:hypothetical protein
MRLWLHQWMPLEMSKLPGITPSMHVAPLQVEDNGIAMVEAIASNYTLTVLDLSSNHLSPECGLLFVEVRRGLLLSRPITTIAITTTTTTTIIIIIIIITTTTTTTTTTTFPDASHCDCACSARP